MKRECWTVNYIDWTTARTCSVLNKYLESSRLRQTVGFLRQSELKIKTLSAWRDNTYCSTGQGKRTVHTYAVETRHGHCIAFAKHVGQNMLSRDSYTSCTLYYFAHIRPRFMQYIISNSYSSFLSTIKLPNKGITYCSQTTVPLNLVRFTWIYSGSALFTMDL